MSKNKINFEIKKTIEIIKKETGIRVRHFSYPEGQTNRNVINYLKKNKILTCPIATGYRNNHWIDPFRIKRVMVGFLNKKFPLN